MPTTDHGYIRCELHGQLYREGDVPRGECVSVRCFCIYTSTEKSLLAMGPEYWTRPEPVTVRADHVCVGDVMFEDVEWRRVVAVGRHPISGAWPLFDLDPYCGWPVAYAPMYGVIVLLGPAHRQEPAPEPAKIWRYGVRCFLETGERRFPTPEEYYLVGTVYGDSVGPPRILRPATAAEVAAREAWERDQLCRDRPSVAQSAASSTASATVGASSQHPHPQGGDAEPSTAVATQDTSLPAGEVETGRQRPPFSSGGYLIDHLEVHRHPYSCTQCEEVLRTLTANIFEANEQSAVDARTLTADEIGDLADLRPSELAALRARGVKDGAP